MSSFSDRVPVGDHLPASDTDTRTQPAFTRVLVPVGDASQAEHIVELARRAGVKEARVLHLSLRESVGGRRFPLETESDASHAVEAMVFELRMAGIGAGGEVRHALIDRAAEAIVADAVEWGADLIVLGFPRRSELATRLFGSLTLRVLRHAPCPVLVASAASRDSLDRVKERVTSAAGHDPDAGHDHPARRQGAHDEGEPWTRNSSSSVGAS